MLQEKNTMRFALLPIALSLAGLVAAGSAAAAEDFPKRKSGLWEIKTSSGPQGKAASPVTGADLQMCVDEKTDNAAQQQAAGMSKQNCSKHDMKRTANGMVIDSVCKLGDTTATTHSVFTGSFDSAYKVDVKATYDPPMMGMKESTMVMEARWLGPCKADQRPGDMILGNGMKINVNDMNKAGGMPPPKAPR